jgi:hypothetical protein
MASTLTVDNIVGATTAANVHIPGAMVQILEAEYATQTNVTATSYFDLGLSVTITPKFATSKIFVMTNVHCYMNGTGFVSVKVVRGSTDVVESLRPHGYTDNSAAIVSLTKLDSPATTSPTTYKIQVKAIAPSSTPRVNDGGGPSRITVMEIAQ